MMDRTARINQTLILKDDRRLGFAEYGAPTGRPVFHYAGEYLRNVLPNTRTNFLPGEGHFLVLRRWEELLLALVNEK